MIVRFHAIAAGGEAVGRDESGRTVFVPLGAPGERAEIEVLEARRSFARGRLLRVLEASPHRVDAPCPVFGACGGCQVQHLSYDAQLQAKTDIVRDAFARIGGFSNAPVEACRPSPNAFAYRNKAEVHAHGGALGFYALGSHQVVDVAQCPIQRAENNALLKFLRDEREAGSVPRNIGAATFRVASNGESQLQLHPRPFAGWSGQFILAERALQSVPGLVGVSMRAPSGRVVPPDEASPTLLAGRDWLEETVCDLKLRVSNFGFFQVNTSLTPTLAQLVREMAGIPHGSGGALDVFCGVGLFALLLARDGWNVKGIEFSRRAVEDARGNAARNGLKARFVAGDAARELAKERDKVELVVLDPPRAGAKECVPALLKLKPSRVIYVSCDPATLARDCQMLREDYELRRVAPLDLFPQTAHVESVAWLQRRT